MGRKKDKSYVEEDCYFNPNSLVDAEIDTDLSDIDADDDIDIKPDEENTAITLNVEAQKVLSDIDELEDSKESQSRKSKSKSKSNFGSSRSKRLNALPYKEMFNFYVRGERVIKGGIKHTTTPTYKEVAERFNCAYSTVASYAAEHSWKDKRKRYREKLSNEFSFHGQLAADVNGQVLNCASMLVKKITKKLIDPTFLATSEAIVEGEGGAFYVEGTDGELIPLPPASANNRGKESEIVQIEKITRSLESINRICNNTVQVEIDNANLLDEIKGQMDTEETAKVRMRRIKELQERIESKTKGGNTMKAKRERAANARAAKKEVEGKR